jgi:hypothetical protein
MSPSDFMHEMGMLGIRRFIVVQSDPSSLSLSDTVEAVSRGLPKDHELWIDVDSIDDIPKVSSKAKFAVLSASRLIEGLG